MLIQFAPDFGSVEFTFYQNIGRIGSVVHDHFICRNSNWGTKAPNPQIENPTLEWYWHVN